MARPRKIRAAVLNVVSHPHSEADYVKLLQAAVRNRIVARYFGNKAGMFGTVNKFEPRHGKAAGVYAGQLHLFTDFDPNSRWFNIAQQSEASDDDVKTISLPPNLRPDHKSVPYLFFAKQHRLVFETEDLAPSSAQKLVELILRSTKVAKERTVSVTVEPAKDTVSSLLAKPNLKLISLTLRRPNPDDLASVEASIQERFRKMNAAAKKEEYKAVSGKNLKPDEELKQIARIAGSNGEVAIKRVDRSGNTVEESTREHPKRLFGEVDGDRESTFDAIFRLGFDHLEER